MESKDKGSKIIIDDFDLVDIAKKIWQNKFFIFKISAVFFAIGLIIAIITPNQYTASTLMVPQSKDRNANGGLSGLAAMAGINLALSSSAEILSPSIYPKILNNTNFQKELLYAKYSFKNIPGRISYYDYVDKYEASLTKPFLYITNISIKSKKIREDHYNLTNFNPNISESDSIIIISHKENEYINKLFKNISLSLNPKEGYISILATTKEPKLSAEIVQNTQNLLHKYITNFKLEKVKSNLDFVEQSFNEAKLNFEKKQEELARFKDANKTISSSLAKTTEEKLYSEYNLLLEVYTEIAKQKEQAKIAVTENTPILTIIQPVVVPTKKSGPNRIITVIGFTFFGFIVGLGWAIFRPIIIQFKNSL